MVIRRHSMNPQRNLPVSLGRCGGAGSEASSSRCRRRSLRNGLAAAGPAAGATCAANHGRGANGPKKKKSEWPRANILLAVLRTCPGTTLVPCSGCPWRRLFRAVVDLVHPDPAAAPNGRHGDAGPASDQADVKTLCITVLCQLACRRRAVLGTDHLQSLVLPSFSASSA